MKILCPQCSRKIDLDQSYLNQKIECSCAHTFYVSEDLLIDESNSDDSSHKSTPRQRATSSCPNANTATEKPTLRKAPKTKRRSRKKRVAAPSPLIKIATATVLILVLGFIFVMSRPVPKKPITVIENAVLNISTDKPEESPTKLNKVAPALVTKTHQEPQAKQMPKAKIKRSIQKELPKLSDPAEKAKAKAVEFLSLINPNMDIPPSKREEEIYKELIHMEGGETHKKHSAKGWGVAGGLNASLDRIELSQDTTWFEGAISMADNLITLLNDPINGVIVESSGKRNEIWLPPQDIENGICTRVAHLSSGVHGSAVLRLAIFILEHPELHRQESPIFFPKKGLDRKTVGKTYLERARFYVKQTERVCDFFINEGSYWAFDKNEKGETMGWWFSNDKKGLSSLNAHRKKEPTWKATPSAFADNQKKYGWDLRAVNRALYINQMLAKTAQALRLLDKIDKKKSAKSRRALKKKTAHYDDIVRHCNNFWRHFSVDVDQGDIKGKNRHFQYIFNKIDKYKNDNACWYSEDMTHFKMDMACVIELAKDDRKKSRTPGSDNKRYFRPDDYTYLAGTIFSRCFSYDANVTYSSLSGAKPQAPKFSFKNGLPVGYGDYMANDRGPIHGDWMGRYGTRAQKMAFMAKCLETYDERIRKTSMDAEFNEFTFSRVDSWRHYRFSHLSVIYEFKKALQETKKKNPSKNNAPVFKTHPDLSIPESTALNTVVTKLEASDPDKGQKLRYWIIGGNAGFCFQMDHNTGELKTSKYYKLDQNLAQNYKLKFMVTDDGLPLKVATQTISITIK